MFFGRGSPPQEHFMRNSATSQTKSMGKHWEIFENNIRLATLARPKYVLPHSLDGFRAWLDLGWTTPAKHAAKHGIWGARGLSLLSSGARATYHSELRPATSHVQDKSCYQARCPSKWQSRAPSHHNLAGTLIVLWKRAWRCRPQSMGKGVPEGHPDANGPRSLGRSEEVLFAKIRFPSDS